ncbi:MAG: serine hydrolase [Prevotella sp.]|nr:serine hydrolase [Prevotella sp.]
MKRTVIFFIEALFCFSAFAQINELERVTPESVGVNSDDVVSMMNALMAYDQTSVHSVVVLRHGKVIAETYPAPFKPEYKHTLYSTSKTFTSAAVGIAIAENRLRLTDRVISFFPECAPDTISDNLANMTVRDLLIMSSGIEPDWEMRNITDAWIPTWFRKEVKPQHKDFKYDSIDTYLLSAIVSRVTGMKLIDYLRDRVFRHMNINDVQWQLSPEGFNTGGWGLYIQPESMAKFGQMLLDGGCWEGKQLIPAEWVKEMMKKQMENGAEGYGYQMWVCEYPSAARADGAFGQYILVVPEKDMVIVVTQCSTLGGNYYRRPIWDFVKKVNPQPLPESKAFVRMKAKLGSYVLKYAEGKKKSTQKLPVKEYRLSENHYGWKTLAFEKQGDEILMRIKHTDGNTTPVRLGYRQWVTAESKAVPVYSVLARGRFTDISGPFHIAGTYGWEKDGTLNIVLHFVDWVTRLEMKATFDEGKVDFTIVENNQNWKFNLKGE